MNKIFENSRFPKRFKCIIIKLNAKNKEGKINCKTLIANLIRVACLREKTDPLVLEIHLFIAAINI